MGTVAGSTMEVNELDPSTLSDDDAAALAAVANAAQVVDAPHLDPVDAEHVRRRHAYDHDMHPTHALLVARDGAALAGYAEVSISHWDNPDLAFIDLEVHPDHRGGGVGSTLSRWVEEVTRRVGRTRLMTDGWLDSPKQAFWRRRGFTLGMVAAQRRLVMADLDQGRLGRLLAQAEAASSDYELVDVPNPAAEEMVPDLLAVHSAINDAPLDDLALDPDAWPAERVRAYERAMTARGFQLHRLLARRRSDGAPGGHTVVVVERDRPWIASQEDTAVVAAHRGHRLGLRLKIAMLHRLAELEPQLRHIDTWNAESNKHMLAVNNAIGCVVVGRSAELQRTSSPA
ncbi:GNAT family N-acetyltransferase [soil metagenome]